MRTLFFIAGAWVLASIPVTFLIGRIMRRSDDDRASLPSRRPPQNHNEPPTIKAA